MPTQNEILFRIEVPSEGPLIITDGQGGTLETCGLVEGDLLRVQGVTVIDVQTKLGVMMKCIITSDGRIVCR